MIAPHQKKYRRNPNCRVFTNRSVAMGKIKAIGFDMDYTLAVYKSPQYEELGFKIIVEKLIKLGYPKDIANYQYDASFVTRGLLFDNYHGNLIKIDGHGNILVASHGLKMLRIQDVKKVYPNQFVQKDDTSRYYIYNTLFNLPEVYLMACVVDLFENMSTSKVTARGIEYDNNLIITYKQLQKDVRAAVNDVHIGTELKNQTVANPTEYIVKDDNLPVLLNRMRRSGKKVFLVTNSGYAYTEKVMTYLFDTPSANGKPWREFFQVSIVDSRKPAFFEEGTLLRQIDTNTKHIKLGRHIGKLADGEVYSGGCFSDVTEMIGCSGKEIMYIGDHIFGDILKSKKQLGWRTFLVVPELADEIHVWQEKKESISILAELDDKIGDLFSALDSSSSKRDIPDISQLQNTLRRVIHDMDMAYGKFGSLFRTGSRNTMFAGQVMRFADLYSSSFINLFNYPFSYLFRAEAQLLPHESSITQEVEGVSDTWKSSKSRNQSEKPVSESVNSESEIAKASPSTHGTFQNMLENSNQITVAMQTSIDCLKSLEIGPSKITPTPASERTFDIDSFEIENSPMITRSTQKDFWKRKSTNQDYEANIILDNNAEVIPPLSLSRISDINTRPVNFGQTLSAQSNHGSRPSTPTYLLHDFDNDSSEYEDCSEDEERREKVVEKEEKNDGNGKNGKNNKTDKESDGDKTLEKCV